jgi:hypothetical protein
MERWRAIIGIAIAVFVAYLFLRHPLVLGPSDDRTNYDISATHTFGHSILASAPHFLLVTTKRHTPEHFDSHKYSKQRRNAKSIGTKISVFTGRGANKNHAIFEILDAKGPLPISDLQKLLNKQRGLEVTYYASLNKRIHALEKGGYVAQARPATPSQKGFKAALYEVRAKFYLARFLNSTSREEILSKLTDTHAIIILAELVNSAVPTKEN